MNMVAFGIKGLADEIDGALSPCVECGFLDRALVQQGFSLFFHNM
jgi:hypothetical protein